jgi:superfamily I DNA/RNA helicase
MLIGEVVPLAYDYLRNNPAAPELLAYDHVIVDEYQDLNTIEQRLLDLLSEHANLCVAGDDDQSIYSMRYANPSGIVEYVERDAVEAHEISICGRCPRQIVDIANSLIKCDGARRPKADLTTTREDEGVVDIVQWDTLDEEVEGTISAIAFEIQRDLYSPGEVLVLVHRRLIGERIRDGLREIEIPVESYFTEEELDTWQAQEALALFRLAVEPEDLPALRVVVGIPDDTGRSAAYRRVLTQARVMNETPLDVLQRLDQGTKFDFRVPAIVERYRAARQRTDQLNLDELEPLIDDLFPEDVAELAGLRRVALAERDVVESARELLDRIVTVITQDEVPQHPSFVRVMSLHKSKGLTSPRVYVAGLIEGVVPTHGNREGHELELAIQEQRRLLYVAITRAAHRLTLSNSLRMEHKVAVKFGARVASNSIRPGTTLTCGVIASRYMRELGPRAPRPVRGLQWLEGLTA